MATKKKTTKKAAPKRVASKAPVKKPVARATKPAAATHRSFRRTARSSQFMDTRFTEQSAYWLIIGAAVIGLAIWLLSVQVKLNDMYDQIDASVRSSAVQVFPKKP